MAQITRAREAEADLLEIWTHIAEDNSYAADKLLRDIHSLCETYAEMPGMGQIRDDVLPGFRSIVVGQYVIFYQTLADGIRVMRVLHGARDLPGQFE